MTTKATATCYCRRHPCPNTNTYCPSSATCTANLLCRDKNNHANGSLTGFPDGHSYNYTGLYYTPSCQDESYGGVWWLHDVGYNIDVYVFCNGGSSYKPVPGAKAGIVIVAAEQGSSSSCSLHCYSGHGKLQPKPEMKVKRIHSGQKSDNRNSRRWRHERTACEAGTEP
ncbi:hypothetical protein CDV55_102939 [Aspergillus turcosus]|uniref:Uncharacterized protein n=1 Tax=Aspergillus turcosus TaxID=1245748 RepID=A0A397GMM5_9EURO|nr:hypothetical protein CDV55_102939 [Aspergillus turcosus]RLL93328.1 hypothetical protein CFD26_101756 [Aspergillus turcosus]